MRGVVFLAVSFLVASRTRRVCNVRASPGIARLGELLGNNQSTFVASGGWQQDAAEVEHGLVRCGHVG